MYRRQGAGCMSSLMMLALGGVMVLALLLVSGLLNPFAGLTNAPPAKLNAPGPAIIQQLRARDEWITFSYQADQIISAEIGGNFLQDLLFGDRLLLQARGEVAGGIDMSQLRDDAIVINGTAVTMTLPPARIIYSKIDNNQTRIYDRERGWLSRGDVNLETQARIYAEESILTSACEAGVLDRAAAQAQTNVTDLLKALSYTTVTVYVSKVSDCAGSATNAQPTPDINFNPTMPPSIPTSTSPIRPTARPTEGGLTGGTVVPIRPTP
jgi:hypothetical protein